MSEKRCPICAVRLESRLEVYDDDPDGPFVQLWRCPNRGKHGIPAECDNGCGEPVLNPRQHYSSVSGLIGSGRWMCWPKREFQAPCFMPALDQTGAREGAYVMCRKSNPCAEHATKE